MFGCGIYRLFNALTRKKPFDFCAARPRAEGAGPAPLVLLRGLRSHLPPSLRSGGCGLLRRLREPAASNGQYQGHALFPSAASGAGTLRLRLRIGLPSLAVEPGLYPSNSVQLTENQFIIQNS